MTSLSSAVTEGSEGTSRDSILERRYSAFAYSRPENDPELDAFVPTIVREYSAAITGYFLGSHAERVATSSAGLVDYVSSWAALPDPAYAVGWDYAFGNVYRSLRSPSADVVEAAAAVALHLGAAGVSGQWSAVLAEPARLRWGDWLLPPARTLEVAAAGRSARLRYNGPTDSGSVELSRAGQGWDATGGDLQARVLDDGVSFSVMAGDALRLREFDELGGRVLPAVDRQMMPVFHEALKIIRQFTPEYVPWVARTLHQLFLLRPTAKTIESGSVEHYLGLVHLTAHHEPLPVAELLVHEATHQYMNVLAKLEPLDDGSDATCYWSPPVNAERPISKIIAALHAFGNVLIFYRNCLERGLPNQKECLRQEALLKGWLEVLAKPIAENRAISATGNALCLPLMGRLGL